jgi:D-sedoheptulose 7-phosphate isomerase
MALMAGQAGGSERSAPHESLVCRGRCGVLAASMATDLSAVLQEASSAQLREVAQCIAETTRCNGCVFICGNGGSGATANVFATSLVQLPGQLGLSAPGAGVRAISLNGNMAIATGAAETGGYHTIFSAQLQALGRAGDLLIAISGSGNSPNVVEAVAVAKQIGITTVGLLGMGGGKLGTLVDLPVIVRSQNMEQIENVHTIMIHAIVRWLAEHRTWLS